MQADTKRLYELDEQIQKLNAEFKSTHESQKAKLKELNEIDDLLTEQEITVGRPGISDKGL